MKKKYLLEKPLGVRGRSSNNDLARKKINWDTTISLKEGLSRTYNWIYEDIKKNVKNNKFASNY